jgi:hypothetical protein
MRHEGLWGAGTMGGLEGRRFDGRLRVRGFICRRCNIMLEVEFGEGGHARGFT